MKHDILRELEASLLTLMKVRLSIQALAPVTIIFISDEITASFRRFGPLVVDWPHKAESKSYFPPKGYAFLLFQVWKYFNVHQMIDILSGRELSAGTDRGLHTGRGQVVPLCEFSYNQRQASPDTTLEAE